MKVIIKGKNKWLPNILKNEGAYLYERIQTAMKSNAKALNIINWKGEVIYKIRIKGARKWFKKK